MLVNLHIINTRVTAASLLYGFMPVEQARQNQRCRTYSRTWRAQQRASDTEARSHAAVVNSLAWQTANEVILFCFVLCFTPPQPPP